jgi:hypothetical protein
MKKTIRLAKLPERAPVRLSITLAPDLAARLRSYADLYAEIYGVREEPTELIPYMLDAFLQGDVAFRNASRAKVGPAVSAAPLTSPPAAQPRIVRDPDIRNLARKDRIAGPRPDASAS